MIEIHKGPWLFSISLAVALAGFCSPVHADEAGLERKIQELTGRIKELEARLPSKPAQQPASATSAAPPAPAPDVVTKGDLPGSFKIPGTDTSLKIGGFARLDAYKDLDGGAAGSVAFFSAIPFNNTPQASRKGQLGLTARQSRLYVRTLTPTSLGDFTTHIEGDFYGAGGNETVANSAAFRLRQAYAELGPWLAGQTWTNMIDLPSLVETLDFIGGNASLQVIRQGQVRYTARFGTSHQLSVALENPESDVFGTVQTTIAAAAGATSTTTLDKAPDVNARYVYAADWGRMSFAGMWRKLTLNNTGGAAINGFVGESSTDTWMWAVQGRIKTFGSDSIQYSAAVGTGVGRYILGTVNNTSAVINDGKLQALHQTGYSLGYQHFWSPAWRSNVVYGRIDSDFPRPAVPTTVPSHVEAAFVNLIWNPVPNGFAGIEWMRGQVRNDTPNKGKNDRIEMSFQYGF